MWGEGMNNLIGIIAITIYIILVFIVSKFLTNKGKEVSRKFVHIMLSNIWFFYLVFIDSLEWALILPALFVVINSLSYKFKIFKSIERENNDGFGTIYYAISILLICIFAYKLGKPLLGLPGILVMGYGDGFAAIIGQKVKSKEYKVGNTTKSIAGSTTMFVLSLIICMINFGLLNIDYFIYKAIGVAAIATVLEAISIKGLDNISVPIVVTILTYLSL